VCALESSVQASSAQGSDDQPQAMSSSVPMIFVVGFEGA
jgi:hypothetical protein